MNQDKSFGQKLMLPFLQPGTLLWLINHELRLWWRELKAKWFLLFITLLTGFAALAIALFWGFTSQMLDPPLFELPRPLPLSFLKIGSGVLLFIFVYSFIQAMQQSIIALFDRGDLDLLVSSPIPPKIIFASRLLSVAAEVFVGFLTFTIPVSLLFILVGWFPLFGIYPALIALSLFATSGAMLLALALVRWMGARRARLVAQVLTMVVAASFFISIQLFNLALNTNHQTPGEFGLPNEPELLSSIGPESWLWIPVKAMFFDLNSLAIVGIVSIGTVWLTIEILNRQFINSTQQVLTTKRSPKVIRQSKFRQGLASIVLTKEWRVILRSPYLLSRTLLSIVFLIPLMIWVLYGQNPRAGLDIEGIATVALPTTGAFLTSSLGVICIAGEEAPDLIKSSPVNGQQIRVLKLLAMLLPVWGILGIFFFLLTLQGIPVVAGIGLVMLSTICTAIIRLWNARPISLSGMMMRQRENAFNDTILGILESVLFFVWIILGTQVNNGNTIGVSALLVFLSFMMAIAYWRSRSLGSSLGF